MSGGSTKRRSMTDYSLASHAQGQRDVDVRLGRYHEYVGRARADRAVWPGAAFIVEALLLLTFLTGSLAVLMQLNADADHARKESAALMDAIVLASNSAEQFASDPSVAAQVQGGEAADPNLVNSEDLLLVREVEVVPSQDGTLYRAVISVWEKDKVAKVDTLSDDPPAYEVILADQSAEPVYQLETARYVAGTTGKDTGTSLANVKGPTSQEEGASDEGGASLEDSPEDDSATADEGQVIPRG